MTGGRRLLGALSSAPLLLSVACGGRTSNGDGNLSGHTIHVVGASGSGADASPSVGGDSGSFGADGSPHSSGLDGSTTPDAAGADGGLEGLESATQVWLGQTQQPVTYPEEYLVDGGSGLPERVVLILRDQTSTLSGSITIGMGSTDPLTAGQPTFAALATFPVSGFEYTLIGPVLSGDYLTLSFAPGEVFTPVCEGCTPHAAPFSICSAVCTVCDSTGCHPDLSYHRELDFVVHGAEMDGQFLGIGLSIASPVAIHLRRVK